MAKVSENVEEILDMSNENICILKQQAAKIRDRRDYEEI